MQFLVSLHNFTTNLCLLSRQRRHRQRLIPRQIQRPDASQNTNTALGAHARFTLGLRIKKNSKWRPLQVNKNNELYMWRMQEYLKK